MGIDGPHIELVAAATLGRALGLLVAITGACCGGASTFLISCALGDLDLALISASTPSARGAAMLSASLVRVFGWHRRRDMANR
jgi:hypothetical protein